MCTLSLILYQLSSSNLTFRCAMIGIVTAQRSNQSVNRRCHLERYFITNHNSQTKSQMDRSQIVNREVAAFPARWMFKTDDLLSRHSIIFSSTCSNVSFDTTSIAEHDTKVSCTGAVLNSATDQLSRNGSLSTCSTYHLPHREAAARSTRPCL
jgi:hypothetical protein